METDLLDARTVEAALGNPILGAANIPLSDLADAGSELPLPGLVVRVADTGPEAEAAVHVLRDMGREAMVSAEFRFGTNVGPLRLWRPNEFLTEALPQLSPCSAVDLGCGAGREAATLAAAGWEVTAVDHLPDALVRAERLARRFGQSRVRYIQADLETWSPAGPWELATMFFFLDRDLVKRVTASLAPGGSFLFESFSDVHRDRFGKPRQPQLAISEAEMIELVQPLEVVCASAEWRESGRHTCRLWARKSF